MPIFEFFCSTCKITIESIEKNDVKKIKCLTCGAKCVKVFPSKMQFKLKGNCWEKDSYTKKH